MRKVFMAVVLIGVLSLFAIPAGTKSLGISAYIGDIMADDFDYSFDVHGGYFFMDNIEGVAGVSFDGTTREGVDAVFGFEGGAYYHMPMSDVLGFYAGAMFGYSNAGDGYMYIPIDAGVEYFVTESFAIRAYNRFQLNLEEGAENSDYIMIGTVNYF